MKNKSKLDKKPTGPKPAYRMAPPNDDAAAYGWSLGKLRHPDPRADPKDKDPDPGPYVFDVPTALAVRQIYGHNIEFVCPAFVQLIFDGEKDIRDGAEKVKAAGYSPEALKKFSKTINDVFTEKVLPEIVGRFAEVAPMVADFYAARLAHIDKFGVED